VCSEEVLHVLEEGAKTAALVDEAALAEEVIGL
jgi:hypothetical protein